MFYSKICIPEVHSSMMEKMSQVAGAEQSIVRVLGEAENYDREHVRRIIFGDFSQLTLPSDTIFTEVKMVSVPDRDIGIEYTAPDGWVMLEIPNKKVSQGAVGCVWKIVLGKISNSFREKDHFDNLEKMFKENEIERMEMTG